MRTRAELIFYILMKTYTKQPISIADQIVMLKGRGLLFDDEHIAIEYLKIISYFRLANYWFVSSAYGPFWFADASLFSNAVIFSKCLANIDEELKRSKEDFLVEHFARYDDPPYPPAWKTLEVSSFGTLSKLYCNLSDNALKKQIAREFGLPQHLYLESWIKSLSVLRNCIAHHARIWNRKYPWKPQLPKKLQNPWIHEAVLQEKLYAQLCCVAYLMDAVCPDNDFRRKLKTLLEDYPIVDVAAMGFPKQWYNEPLWSR